MKHKTFFTVLVMAVTITGCKVQKKSEVATKQAQAKPRPAQPKQVTNRELRLGDVFVEFEGQAQPNIYDMVFSWPETRDRVRISVDGQVMFAVNTSERLEEAVANLQGGRKVSVLVEILDQQYHIITSETRELEVPTDYIFSKNFILTNHLNITNERVFMRSSTITTQNFNLKIKTKKLIVLETSFIQGFDQNYKPKPKQGGRSGGEIRIEAESAEGVLDITLNSEAGGDGFKGIWACSSAPGTICLNNLMCRQGGNGLNAGRNGDLYVTIKDVTNFHLYPQTIINSGGKPGPKFDAVTESDYPLFMFGKEECPAQPAHGAEAVPGKICLTLAGSVPEKGCE